MSVYGWLAWISTISSGIGCYLNIKKRKVCFLYWGFGTILIIYNFLFGVPDKAVYWATATLFTIFGLTNIYGYITWKKQEDTSNSN